MTGPYVNKTWPLVGKTNLAAKYYITIRKECTVHLRISVLGPGNQEGLP